MCCFIHYTSQQSQSKCQQKIVQPNFVCHFKIPKNSRLFLIPQRYLLWDYEMIVHLRSEPKKTHMLFVYVFFLLCLYSAILFSWFPWCKLRMTLKCKKKSKMKSNNNKTYLVQAKNSQNDKWTCYVKWADFRHYYAVVGIFKSVLYSRNRKKRREVEDTWKDGTTHKTHL